MKESARRFATLAEWLLLGSLSGAVCGVASAVFLRLLDHATAYRSSHETIVYALPIAGLLIGLLIERFGAPIKGGSDLVIDTLHDDGPELPLRMAPMVLVGTVLTHLFGGSAGREGTAVQMGASLTDWLSHRLALGKRLRAQLLAAGIAGGFGSVFGTPIAGAIFGLEVVVLGRMRYDALVPALAASIVGDLTTRALGAQHSSYPHLISVSLTPLLLLKWLVFAAAIALSAMVFIELTHFIRKSGERYLERLPIRMFIGGLSILFLWWLVGSSEYLGLSLPLMMRAFHDPTLPAYAFAAKLLFTALTLGAGFLGGEVTPLFVVGATLGGLLGRVLGIPVELAAGVGMAAAFAAASNTPLALSVMAVELLGGGAFPHVAIVCVLAYLVTGHRSIYPAQRLTQGKHGVRLAERIALRDLRKPTSPPKANAPPPSNPKP